MAQTSLTKQDKEVFDHIVAFEFAHQRMPTRKELLFYTGISHGQLSRNLNRLAELGLLQKLPLGTIDYAIVNPERTIQAVPDMKKKNIQSTKNID